MITDILIVLGSFCFFTASLGLFRMPDSYSRIHAATKASSLGVFLLSIAAIIEFPTPAGIFFSLMIIFLVFFTAPIASHTIAIRLLGETPKDNPED